MNLFVWAHEQRVGLLSHDGVTGRFAFRYEMEWLSRRNAFPLCPTLPLSITSDQDTDAHSVAVRQAAQALHCAPLIAKVERKLF